MSFDYWKDPANYEELKKIWTYSEKREPLETVGGVEELSSESF